MDKNAGKIAYERAGVRNHWSEEQIQQHGEGFPENHGWTKVPQEVLDKEAELKAAAQGGGAPSKPKEADVIAAIAKVKTLEELAAITDGDERKKVVKARDEKEAELKAAAQGA